MGVRESWSAWRESRSGRAGCVRGTPRRVPSRGSRSAQSAPHAVDRLPAPVLQGRRGECEALDRLLAARPRGRRARCWCCAARPGSARRRCWTTSPSRRPAAASRGRRASSPRWSSRSPGCISCARRCSTGSRRCRPAARRAAGRRSACRPAQPPDRFLVALAVLSLLAEAAEEQPLVCRRRRRAVARPGLGADARVRRPAAAGRARRAGVRRPRAQRRRRARRPAGAAWSAGSPTATRARCWTSAIRGRLDERVRDRIVAETRGNPLALLELPRGLTPAELAGGFGLPDARPLASRIERELPAARPSAPARDAAAAARGGGRAGRRREPAVARGRAARDRRRRGAAGRGGRADRARHPGALPPSAGALGGLPRGGRARPPGGASRARRGDRSGTDPDRRAWHRAHAAAGPDEAVAAELERSADRAQGRGGAAAAAAFLERAAELTPDPARRGERALAAAQAKLDAGAPDAALELLATAELGPLDELQRARLERLRAQIAFARTRGSDAPPLLLDAARRLEPLDADAGARDLPRGARRRRCSPAGSATSRTSARSPRPLAPRRRPRSRPARSTCSSTAWRRGSPRATRRRAPAPAGPRRVPPRGRIDGDATLRWLWLACRARAGAVGRRALARARHPRRPRRARDRRARRLPIAATYRAALHVHAGELRRRGGADRGGRRDHRRRPASRRCRYASLMLAAWRGDEAEALGLIDAGCQDATARGEGIGARHGRAARPRCSTTASAATTRRSPPRSEPASTTTSGSSAGRSSS